MTPRSLRTLLSGLIDYAGLFPPAELGMAEAIDQHARHLLAAEGWMLARFVVPVARLGELDVAAREYLPQEAGVEPWRLAVLAGDDGDADRDAVERFNHAHAARAGAGRALVDTVETRTADAAAIARAARDFAGLQLFCEVPWDGPLEAALAAAAEAAGEGATVGLKVRTGGVTPGAVPSADALAGFLLAAARAGVAWKATAGLHHALRGEHPLTYEAASPRAAMHGFLNLFVAAALARAGGVDRRDLVRLLEERSAAGLEADDAAIRWQGHEVGVDALAAGRRFARSYGSCSFAEPLAELQELGLL